MNCLHCNKCGQMTNWAQCTNYMITSCGHLYCQNCARNLTQSNMCTLCGTKNITLASILKMRDMFKDPILIIKEAMETAQRAEKFQMKQFQSFLRLVRNVDTCVEKIGKESEHIGPAYQKAVREEKRLKQERDQTLNIFQEFRDRLDGDAALGCTPLRPPRPPQVLMNKNIRQPVAQRPSPTSSQQSQRPITPQPNIGQNGGRVSNWREPQNTSPIHYAEGRLSQRIGSKSSRDTSPGSQQGLRTFQDPRNTLDMNKSPLRTSRSPQGLMTPNSYCPLGLSPPSSQRSTTTPPSISSQQNSHVLNWRQQVTPPKKASPVHYGVERLSLLRRS